MTSMSSLRACARLLALVYCFGFAVDPVLANDSGDWVAERFKAVDQARAPARRSNLGRTSPAREAPKSLARGSGRSGDITWQASAGCVPSQLRGVLNDLASSFGPVRVTSTCRSQSANRAAGGASKSYHLSGEAVDFRVAGNTGAVQSYLARHASVGGLKHYGGGLFHIDTGPRRTF